MSAAASRLVAARVLDFESGDGVLADLCRRASPATSDPARKLRAAAASLAPDARARVEKFTAAIEAAMSTEFAPASSRER